MQLSRNLIVATRNNGKFREFASLFEPLGIAVKSLNDVSNAPEIAEDGDTFSANALKKARTIAETFGTLALADDSGLCVDALDGRPGVYSARFAGEGGKDADNNAKLLAELNRLHDQGKLKTETVQIEGQRASLLSPAKFVCALALADPNGQSLMVEADCRGYVIDQPFGGNGFGYDPLFYIPEFGMTMAQLSPNEKNRISHRAQALIKLREKLKSAPIT